MIEEQDERGEKAWIRRKRRGRVKAGAVRRPVVAEGADAPFGEDLLFRAIREVVQKDDRRNLLIKLVVQAALVRGDGVLAIARDAPAVNPVRIRRQARDFAVLDADFIKAHRGSVVCVVHDVRIVLLALEFLFIERRVFFRAVNQSVVVEPFDVLRRAGKFRERPGLAAARVDEPDLHRRGVRFGLRARTRAEEGDGLAVGRPAGLRVVVCAARERNLTVFRQARQKKIGDPGVFFFVAAAFHPHGPLAVRRDPELAGRLPINDVCGLPRLFRSGLLLVGAKRSEANGNRRQKRYRENGLGIHQ